MKPSVLARESLASVVVFLVALPLCMGIAIASGASLASGLLSGIVGGIVVGTLAGSPLQVSGPAASLTVLVYEIIKDHGTSTLGVVVVLAGLLQLIAGWLQLGRWFRAIAPGVLQAMLAGIGILIAASQLHVMIDDVPAASGVANIVALPAALLKVLAADDGTTHHMAAMIGLLTFALLVGWNAVRERLPSGVSALPAPLIAVGSATAAAAIVDLPVAYVDVPNRLGDMLNIPKLSDFAAVLDPAVLGSAVAIAAIASAASLLSASAVDRMHTGVRSDLDRELLAQGVGNTLLGFLGGLPITGVIVRSTANVQAGATTRLSAILHGFWLLGTVAIIPFALEMIPVSALAAVLVYVGFKLVNVESMRGLLHHGRSELFIYAATVVVIVAANVLTGLMVGIVLSLAHLAVKFSRIRVRVEAAQEGVIAVHLYGTATFVSLPSLASALEAIEPTAAVELHLEHLAYVDHACLELIGDWERQREQQGGTLVLQWDELWLRSRAPRLTSADGTMPESD